MYPFHYSDGDNWSARDTERCIHLLRDEILPRVNQFCYGQVKSAYGSGQFKKDLDSALEGEEKLVTASINDREGIRCDPRVPRPGRWGQSCPARRRSRPPSRTGALDRGVAREAGSTYSTSTSRCSTRRTSTRSRPTADSPCAIPPGASAWSSSAWRRGRLRPARIYELVISNDPAVAYLVRTNAAVREARHGPSSATRTSSEPNVVRANRSQDLLDRMADHGRACAVHRRPRAGQGRDFPRPRARSSPSSTRSSRLAREPPRQRRPASPAARAPARAHDARRRARRAVAEALAKVPTYDVTGFVAEHAPLAEWQRESAADHCARRRTTSPAADDAAS